MASAADGAVDYASGDHYNVLGLARNASEADISRAYKALALRHHPDKNPSDERALVSFNRVAEAYAVLRDANRRREYDRQGHVTRARVSYVEVERLWRSFQGGADFVEGDDATRPFRDVAAVRAEGRRKLALVIATLVFFLAAPRWLVALPTAAALVVSLSLLVQRERASPFTWAVLAVVLASYVVPWALRTAQGPPTPVNGQPLEGASLPREPFLRNDPANNDGEWWIPHSGEEYLNDDGTFTRRPDPTRGASAGDEAAGGAGFDGGHALSPGWEAQLWAALQAAIHGGQAQVVLVFSREGCLWCDRQLPVLRRVLQSRRAASRAAGSAAGGAASARSSSGSRGPASGAAFGKTAFGGGAFAPRLGRGGRRRAGGAASGEDPAKRTAALPLRAFVLDADELPELAHAFGVEVFPTLVAWGVSGSPPLLHAGYLDNAGLEQLLRAAASSGRGQAGRGEKEAPRRRGLFR